MKGETPSSSNVEKITVHAFSTDLCTADHLSYVWRRRICISFLVLEKRNLTIRVWVEACLVLMLREIILCLVAEYAGHFRRICSGDSSKPTSLQLPKEQSPSGLCPDKCLTRYPQGYWEERKRSWILTLETSYMLCTRACVPSVKNTYVA